MDQHARREAASSLSGAYKSGEAIAPLVETYPDLTLDDAYEIQQLQLQERLDGGVGAVNIQRIAPAVHIAVLGLGRSLGRNLEFRERD